MSTPTTTGSARAPRWPSASTPRARVSFQRSIPSVGWLPSMPACDFSPRRKCRYSESSMPPIRNVEVEAEGALRALRRRGKPAKTRVLVDESLDQPCTGDPVHATGVVTSPRYALGTCRHRAAGRGPRSRAAHPATRWFRCASRSRSQRPRRQASKTSAKRSRRGALSSPHNWPVCTRATVRLAIAPIRLKVGFTPCSGPSIGLASRLSRRSTATSFATRSGNNFWACKACSSGTTSLKAGLRHASLPTSNRTPSNGERRNSTRLPGPAAHACDRHRRRSR